MDKHALFSEELSLDNMLNGKIIRKRYIKGEMVKILRTFHFCFNYNYTIHVV